MITIPIDIKIAFVEQIEAAAQGWKDKTQSYEEFRRILDIMTLALYKAGMDSMTEADRK